VWEQTQELIQHPDVILREYSRRVQTKKQGELDLTALLMKKQKEIHYQALEKKRLLDLYQTGILALEEITPRLEVIRDRLKHIQREDALLAEEKQCEQKQLQMIEQFSTCQKKFSSRLGSLTFEEKKHVVRLLVDEVWVDSIHAKLIVKHGIPLDKRVPLRSGSGELLLGL